MKNLGKKKRPPLRKSSHLAQESLSEREDGQHGRKVGRGVILR